MIFKKHIARSSWPLGRVIRLVKSDDGETRGAELRTENGTLHRPVNLLHPLEMGD